VFAIAAETGWSEKRILFMPLARLAQYQHCLLRRNGVRTFWMSRGVDIMRTMENLSIMKNVWRPKHHS
jgi:hypothetical protein